MRDDGRTGGQKKPRQASAAGGSFREDLVDALLCSESPEPTLVLFSSTLSTTGSRTSVFVIMLSFQYKLHFSRCTRGCTVREIAILPSAAVRSVYVCVLLVARAPSPRCLSS